MAIQVLHHRQVTLPDGLIQIILSICAHYCGILKLFLLKLQWTEITEILAKLQKI